MSKYYLWSANKNGRFRYDSVLTGSNSFTDGSTSINATKEAYSTVVSPDGEKLFRFARHGNGAQYTGSYFAIHQSQSSIPGGFHFGAGKSSDSVVFSSFLTNNYNNANSDNPGATAAWLSNTEIAIMVPYVYSYGLMDNHTLTGAGFPSEIANNSGASGLFMILTGSGASWEVAFWHTGSSQLQIADAPDGQATQMWQYDMVVPNHRYTTTETDLILVGSTSNYNTTPGSDNRATVFKKTAGSWGFHSNFYYDGQTTRQTSNAIRYANFLGDDQDLIGISYSDSKSSNLFAIFEPSGSSGNTRHSRISSTLSSWNHFAWDPYESKFLGNLSNVLMVIPSSSNWTDNVLGDAATQNAASEIEVQLANSSLPEFPSAGNTGKEMLKWKFSSGYTGIVYGGFFGWSQLLYLESGSYGWLGVGHNSNSRQQYYEAYYEVINGDKTDWQGGADIFGAEGNSNNLNKILVGAYKRNAQLTWDWNTTKGGTGDVLFSLEGKGTGTFDEQQSTGRSVFLNFRAYSGVTPDEWVPISSDTAGSTTYQASSSVASGLTYASHATGMESELTQNHSYSPRGGKFSPDGTKLAMATMYIGNGVGRTTSDVKSGVDIWESGSSGWSFLTGAACHLQSTSPVADVVWLSNSQIVAVQTTTGVLMPITWTSSSSGWDAESSYLVDYSSDVTDEDPNAKSNLRSANKILLNEDKKAFVLYNGANGSWGSFVSSSAGTNGFVGYAHITEGMNNFVWASSSHDNRYRLIGRGDDQAHFSIGLIDKTTGRDTGGALRENINKFEFSHTTSGDFANFMFYHSGSDSLIFTDLNNLVVEHKLTPFGTDLGYDNGTSTYPSGTYHPHWLGQSTAETPEARTQPYFLNADYHPTVGFPISSSVGRGRFDDADDSSQANGAPFPNGKIISDPNSADRFFVSKDHENSTNPFKLKVLERGSSGWKMTNVFSTSSNLYTDNYYVRQQTEFDFSSRGDLVIPHATANTGFSIANLVAPPPADPDLASTVSKAITAGDGGTVAAGGTQSTPRASISIPANALSANTTITVDVSESPVPGTLGLGENGDEPLSPLVRLTPHGTSFSQAVTVTFNLIGSGAGACPANAQLFKRNAESTSWYPVPTNLYSCNNGVITLSTTSFSDYIIIGGQKVARTKLNNVQLARLEDANKVLPEAINITGSSESHKTDIADADLLLVQDAASGVSQPISASALAAYMAGEGVDLVEKDDAVAYSLIFATGTTGAILGKDNDLTFNASTNALSGAGAFLAGGGITIAGAADLNSTLNLEGVATFQADITASAGMHIAEEIHVDGAADLDGTLNVQDVATFQADITASAGMHIAEELHVDGILQADGAADLNSTLNVQDVATFQADITASAGMHVAEEMHVDGVLQADGAADLNSTLNVQDVATFQADITASAGMHIAQELHVDGILQADGAADLNSTLNVQDVATFQADITASSGLHVDGGAEINSLKVEDLTSGRVVLAGTGGEIEDSGNLTFNGTTLTVAGTGSFAGDLTVQGNLNINGTTTTIDTANLQVEDSVILLGSGSAGEGAAGDRGLLMAIGSETNPAMFWDESDSQFAFVRTAASGTDNAITADEYSDLRLNDLTGSAAKYSGIVSASAFQGDGAALKNVGASVEDSTDANLALQVPFLSGSGASTTLFIDSSSFTYNPSSKELGLTAVTASGQIRAGGALTVAGAADLNSTLNLEGVATFQADITASAGMRIAEELNVVGALDVDGATTLDGLIVAEVATFQADITASAGMHITEELHVDGILQADGAADLNSTLNVQDVATFQADITASAGMHVAEEMHVDGILQADGAADLNSTLNVQDVATFQADITASAGMHIAQELHVDGVLQADGAADLNSTLNVQDVATFQADITASAGMHIAEEIHVDGAADLDGTLDVAGAVTLANASVTFSALADLDESSVSSADKFIIQDADASGVAKEITLADVGHYFAQSGSTQGIQVHNDTGKISISYKELVATRYERGSILDTSFLTASLVSGDDPLDGSLQVYLNGMLLVQSGSVEVSSSAGGVAAIFDYKYAGSAGARRVEFVDALDEDDVIQIKYIKK